jgi:hypothetical protein
MATLVFVFVFARRPLARPPARPSVRRSASPILACKLLTSPRISCGVVRRPADSLRPTSLGPFANSITDYAQSGRCLQQQATSVSVLVVLHVLPVGQQLRTVASSSRIHWRAAPCLDWAFDLVSGVPYPTFFRFFSRSPFFSLSIRIGIDPPLSLCTLHLYLSCAPMM